LTKSETASQKATEFQKKMRPFVHTPRTVNKFARDDAINKITFSMEALFRKGFRMSIPDNDCYMREWLSHTISHEILNKSEIYPSQDFFVLFKIADRGFLVGRKVDSASTNLWGHFETGVIYLVLANGMVEFFFTREDLGLLRSYQPINKTLEHELKN
jgi:hypothetical protein